MAAERDSGSHELRTRVVMVRMTDEELAWARALAEEWGVSVPAVVRRLLRERRPVHG